ncbi:Abi-like protein [compost metagenome]
MPLAIWVACEVWDFGTLSTLFGGLTETDQDAISQQYGISNGRTFATWLHSLTYLRNVCAHHSRLWNRNVVRYPGLPSPDEVPQLAHFHTVSHRKPFVLLLMTLHLMKVINPASSWGQRLKRLLEQDFPDLRHLGLGLEGMGAPDRWQEMAAW